MAFSLIKPAAVVQGHPVVDFALRGRYGGGPLTLYLANVVVGRTPCRAYGVHMYILPYVVTLKP